MSYQFQLKQFRFSQNSPNTTGSAAIPIGTIIPTVLAHFQIHTNRDDSVQLVGNVGWRADGDGVSNFVSVLFEILRGNTVIYSASDSAVSEKDNLRLTPLSHIDSGFTSSGDVTYTLRATTEFPANPTASTAIGPISLYGKRIDTDK